MAKGSRGGKRGTVGAFSRKAPKKPTRWKEDPNSAGYYGDLKASSLQVGDVIPPASSRHITMYINKGTPWEYHKKPAVAEVNVTEIKKTAKQTKVKGYYDTTSGLGLSNVKERQYVEFTLKNDRDVKIRIK